MGTSGSLEEGGREREVTLKAFDALALYLDQSSLEPPASAGELLFGAVYLLPDRETHFGQRDMHPWVVIQSAVPGRPRVTLCPRTTRDVGRRGPKYLPSPAGVLQRLDRDGLILLTVRHPLHSSSLQQYEYIGLLPDAHREQLRRALDALKRRVAMRSQES